MREERRWHFWVVRTKGGFRIYETRNLSSLVSFITYLHSSHLYFIMYASKSTHFLQCAQKILDVVGPCSTETVRLIPSGRAPAMPHMRLVDLLDNGVHERLVDPTRVKMAMCVEKSLAHVREKLAEECQRALAGQYTLDRFGLQDVEVESGILHMFEAHYWLFIDKIKAILRRFIARIPVAAPANTRGGFGDVSHSHITQANIQRTLRILETAFSYTKSPLSTEIDHLSKLTSLEPHQVRPHIHSSIHSRLIARCALGYVHYLPSPPTPSSFPPPSLLSSALMVADLVVV